jgi:hypothetical protein
MTERHAQPADAEEAAPTCGAQSDPFAGSRGVRVFVTPDQAVHIAGCRLLRDAAKQPCAEYYLCRRCVIVRPTADRLIFANASDTVPLIHNDPSCLLTGNTQLAPVLICGRCSAMLCPKVLARGATAVG